MGTGTANGASSPAVFEGFEPAGADSNLRGEYSYMRRVAAMLGTAAMVLFVAGVYAQGKASDFAGKWTREAPAGGGAAAGGGGGGGNRGGGGGGGAAGGGGQRGGFGGGGFNCGMSCEITASGNTLTVKTTGRNGDQTATFNTSGESTNKGGRGGDMDIKTTGKWDGSKIVFSTTQDMNGNSVTVKQTLSIEGGKLVVETDRGNGNPTKTTYTKG